jgi:hypothetical protein
VHRRHAGEAEVHLAPFDVEADAAVLGAARFRDVQAGHDFEAGEQAELERLGRRRDLAQHAVHAVADADRAGEGLDVQVGRAVFHGLDQQQVDELDDGGLGREVLEADFHFARAAEVVALAAFFARQHVDDVFEPFLADAVVVVDRHDDVFFVAHARLDVVFGKHQAQVVDHAHVHRIGDGHDQDGAHAGLDPLVDGEGAELARRRGREERRQALHLLLVLEVELRHLAVREAGLLGQGLDEVGFAGHGGLAHAELVLGDVAPLGEIALPRQVDPGDGGMAAPRLGNAPRRFAGGLDRLAELLARLGDLVHRHAAFDLQEVLHVLAGALEQLFVLAHGAELPGKSSLKRRRRCSRPRRAARRKRADQGAVGKGNPPRELRHCSRARSGAQSRRL